MTLGGAPEALVLGYLRNQRLVGSIEDIASVQVDWETESAAVTTRGGIADLDEKTARRTVTTGCGQGTVFGSLMDEIDAIHLPPGVADADHTLYHVVDTIRLQQSIYKQAGSVHGCALFDARGELLIFIEDVGRHNAVDAIAGRMWLDGMDGGDKIFYTTGRLTSEMVIKGAQMGIRSCCRARASRRWATRWRSGSTEPVRAVHRASFPALHRTGPLHRRAGDGRCGRPARGAAAARGIRPISAAQVSPADLGFSVTGLGVQSAFRSGPALPT